MIQETGRASPTAAAFDDAHPCLPSEPHGAGSPAMAYQAGDAPRDSLSQACGPGAHRSSRAKDSGCGFMEKGLSASL